MFAVVLPYRLLKAPYVSSGYSLCSDHIIIKQELLKQNEFSAGIFIVLTLHDFLKTLPERIYRYTSGDK